MAENRRQAIESRLKDLVTAIDNRKNYMKDNETIFKNVAEMGKQISKIKNEIKKSMIEGQLDEVETDDVVVNIKEKFSFKPKKDQIDLLLDYEGDELEEELKKFLHDSTKRNDIISIRKRARQ